MIEIYRGRPPFAGGIQPHSLLYNLDKSLGKIAVVPK